MPKYVTFFSYTSESWAAMLEKPGDRAAAVRKVTKAAGGKLEAFYWMIGPHDGLAIFDLPDDEAYASVAIAVASTGALGHIEGHRLIAPDETAAVLEGAKKARGAYAPPGR